MLRTLVLLALVCSGFWFGVSYVAEEFPAQAGRVALTAIVGCVVLFRAHSTRKLKYEFEVLNHKLDRINATVVDIQQNPIVEFNMKERNEGR